MSSAYFLGARLTLVKNASGPVVSRRHLTRLATTIATATNFAGLIGCSQTQTSLLSYRRDQEFESRERASLRSYITASSPPLSQLRASHHHNDINLTLTRTFSTKSVSYLRHDHDRNNLDGTHAPSRTETSKSAPTSIPPKDNQSLETLLSRIQTFFKLASHSHSDHDHGHDHGHSHGLGHHHHHEANPFLTSSDTTDAAVRITRLGLLVNILMAIFKGIGGWIFNSQALIADAFHSLTDLVADVLTLSTVTLAKKKPNARFPNGYGKLESLGSVGVSGILLVGGTLMGYSALVSLYAEFFVENAADFIAHHGHLGHDHSHGHGHGHEGPSVHAAWLAAGSILIKEWLYRATMKVAKERKSTILASNAIHHRIDSLTSIVALLAIGGSHFLPSATYLDPIGGLIVSIMVVNAGYQNTKSAVLELADVGLDGEVKEQVTSSAEKYLATLSQSITVKNVGGIKSGQNLLVEVELQVDDKSTVGQLKEVEKGVREVVGVNVNGVKKVRVRFVGEESLNEFVEEVEEKKEK